MRGCSRPAKAGRCQLHGSSLRCVVAGCERRPLGRVEADALGPTGRRCAAHGGACTVPGCRRSHWGTVAADDLGPQGRRCFKHGGRTCSVAECVCRPVRRVLEPDEFGAPGLRCKSHCQKKRGPMQRRSRDRPRSAPQPGRCSRADGRGWQCKHPAPLTRWG